MSESFEQDPLRDPLIERVRETLRSSPGAKPDAAAMGRVLQAVWAEPRASFWRRLTDPLRMTTFTRLGAAAVAGAALFVGFLWRNAVTPSTAASPLAATGPATGEYPVQYASDAAADPATVAVPTQFVFENAKAKQVSLVGDFNDWKAGETPLVKLESGLWTATVPLPPGRHVYAFVLDGTLLVADPRAPKAGDADYGREGSVVMVFAR